MEASLSDEDMIKLLKEKGYKVAKDGDEPYLIINKDDRLEDISKSLDEIYQVIKSLDKSWVFFHLSENVKKWCEDLKQSAIEYSNDQARCALCGEDLSKKNAYVEGRSYFKLTKFYPSYHPL